MDLELVLAVTGMLLMAPVGVLLIIGWFVIVDAVLVGRRRGVTEPPHYPYPLELADPPPTTEDDGGMLAMDGWSRSSSTNDGGSGGTRPGQSVPQTIVLGTQDASGTAAAGRHDRGAAA